MSSSTIGNNFIAGMGAVASSNVLQGKFDSAASNVKNATDDDKKKAALQKFEGMFVSEMMKLMFNTVKTDPNFGGGFAEDTYRDMLTDQFGDSISKHGGIGIASELQKSIFDYSEIDSQASKVMQASNAYSKVYNAK